jgi:hypothetical protein
MKKINNMLENLYGESELKDNVIDILLDHIEDYEEPKGFLEDIMNYGCISGTVPELIYYNETKCFFIKHMEEIFDIYNQLKDNLSDDFEVNANNLSWLAFEYMVSEIYNEVETMEEEEEEEI